MLAAPPGPLRQLDPHPTVMTDLASLRANDSPPGGDGGHGPADPPPVPSAVDIEASGGDPGGDGGTSGVGTDQDPTAFHDLAVTG